MGYRIYLGKVPKSAKKKYAGKTYDELTESYGEFQGGGYHFEKHHIPELTTLFGLGKYVDFAQFVEPFFAFEDSDCEFYIMSKEGLANIIDEYHDSTYKYFNEMDKEDFDRYRKGKVQEWDKNWLLNTKPYYLDEPEEKCDGFIVSSWKIEYAIFNLVYIYRTFDWDNDYLIYYGY